MPSPALRRSTLAAAATTAACALALTPLTPASAAIVIDPIEYAAPDAALSLTPIGTFETGIFDESAAEIVQAHGDRLFVVNAQAGSVTVLDYSDPTAITEDFAISSEGIANSVAVRADGLGIIAFEAPVKTDPGHLIFFDADAATAEAAYLGEVTVGALPDMVTITPDGAYAVVANEGEPAEDFSTDPEGSISVVKLHPTKKKASNQGNVRTADFHAFEAGGTKTLPEGVRVFGPQPDADFPVSRNLEPEFVAVDGGTAYVALQEANAVAVVDIASAKVSSIWPLGYKDFSLPQNALDPSDKDGAFDLRTFDGLYGVYMPDGINAYTTGGTTYLVTANEGDAREWGDYAEGERVGALAKAGLVCADSPLAAHTANSELGRLTVTTTLGFDETAGCYAELYAFGARSFSIWTTDGTQVFDSGSSFEEITHAASPDFFNSTHTEANVEGRSDDKGPEPENLSIGTIDGRTYAFIGFERIGGVAVYDITTPADSTFVTYVNNRDFTAVADTPAAGDLGPEGVTFIPAAASPTGEPLLAVANEVSGTTTLFSVTIEN